MPPKTDQPDPFDTDAPKVPPKTPIQVAADKAREAKVKDKTFAYKGRDRVFVGSFPGRKLDDEGNAIDVEIRFGSVDDNDDQGRPTPGTMPSKDTIDGVAWAALLASKPHKLAIDDLVARDLLVVRDAA